MPTLKIFEHAGFLVRHHFLGQDTCAKLCREIERASLEKALILKDNGEDCLDEQVRRVQRASLPKEVTSPIEDQLKALLPELERHFSVTLVEREASDYLRYGPGDFYKPHTDDCSDPAAREVIRRRRVSVVIFLNGESLEEAEGTYGHGRLTFYGLLEGPQWERCSFALSAEQGMLVAFPSDKLHGVAPVSFGRRFSLVTWYLGPKPEARPASATPAADIIPGLPEITEGVSRHSPGGS